MLQTKINYENNIDIAIALCHKWHNVIFSTQEIRQQKVIYAVELTYKLLQIELPEIVFCDSPLEAFDLLILNQTLAEKITQLVNNINNLINSKIGDLSDNYLTNIEEICNKINREKFFTNFLAYLNLKPSLLRQLSEEFIETIKLFLTENEFIQLTKKLSIIPTHTQEQLGDHLEKQFKSKVFNQILYELEKTITINLNPNLSQPIIQSISNYLWPYLDQLSIDHRQLQFWFNYSALIDFCITKLGCKIDSKKWKALQMFLIHCGGIYATEKSCIICDRPQKLIWNDRNLLHAIDQAAIQFKDGYNIYFYEGFVIPNQYKNSPEQWLNQKGYKIIQSNNKINLKNNLVQQKSFNNSPKLKIRRKHKINYEQILVYILSLIKIIIDVLGYILLRICWQIDKILGYVLNLIIDNIIKPKAKNNNNYYNYLETQNLDLFIDNNQQEIINQDFEFIFGNFQFKQNLETIVLDTPLRINTKPIKFKQAQSAIFQLYKSLNKKPAKICFYDQMKSASGEINLYDDILKRIIDSLMSLEGKIIIRQTIDNFTKQNIKNSINYTERYKKLKKITSLLDNFLVKKLQEYLGKRIVISLDKAMWQIPDRSNNVRQITNNYMNIISYLEYSYKKIFEKKIAQCIALQDYDNSTYHEYDFWELICELHGVFEYLKPDLCIFQNIFINSLINNTNIDKKLAKIIQKVHQECGWILAFEKVCLVGDHPNKILLDSENRFHGEGESALEYNNLFKKYYYHGVEIPEQYGILHSNLWEAKWLLTEKNAEIRRLLIQAIGYSKICQELNAIILDTWREYSLLHIENQIDIEPIYLLKMTCPSTNFIHTIRVPPNMRSAREAIKWVNWDVDPEEFIVET